MDQSNGHTKPGWGCWHELMDAAFKKNTQSGRPLLNPSIQQLFVFVIKPSGIVPVGC
jgi:hypothetical protein